MSRTCVICGVSIEHRSPKAKVCTAPECMREKDRRYAAARRPTRKAEDAIARRARYAAKRDIILQQGKDWRKRNADKFKAQRQRHYQKNRAKVLAERKSKYWANPAAARETRRLERERNVEAERERDRQRNAQPARQEWRRRYSDKKFAALKLIREIETKGLEALL